MQNWGSHLVTGNHRIFPIVLCLQQGWWDTDMALRTADAGAVGCAMLTGVAIGAFRDLPDAAGHMVEQVQTYHPRPEMHERYMTLYERYERVYAAVRPLV